MAEFEQSAASRQAMRDAAKQYLRRASVISALAGTSDKKSRAYKSAQRRVERWTAAPGQQQRKASAAALATVAGALEVDIVADYAVADDSKYSRRNKHMTKVLPSQVSSDFLAQALNNPDEAWQTFLDWYVIPAGTAERATVKLV